MKPLKAFTLVELLVVIAIISILAALLFPVFLRAQSKALQTVCLSNMHQIGLAISMYGQDYDGLYPYGLDPADKHEPNLWAEYPAFNAQIPHLPMLHTILMPYVHSSEVFHCPADSGFQIDEQTGPQIDPFSNPPNAEPTCFKKYGTSYMYHTILCVLHLNDNALPYPSQTLIMQDGSGMWHGGQFHLDLRYNTLFADDHCKLLNYYQLQASWDEPVQ